MSDQPYKPRKRHIPRKPQNPRRPHVNVQLPKAGAAALAMQELVERGVFTRERQLAPGVAERLEKATRRSR
jgi:hypothetical protein